MKIDLTLFKRFLIHTFGWMVTYAAIGWLIDISNKSEASTTTHIVILVVLSVLMALITYRG